MSLLNFDVGLYCRIGMYCFFKILSQTMDFLDNIRTQIPNHCFELFLVLKFQIHWNFKHRRAFKSSTPFYLLEKFTTGYGILIGKRPPSSAYLVLYSSGFVKAAIRRSDSLILIYPWNKLMWSNKRTILKPTVSDSNCIWEAE